MTETTMQSKDDYLSAHAFFAGLNQDYLQLLSGFATEKQFKRGDVLFQQGKSADKFYLVREGKVSVEVPALVGPAMQLQVLGENQILGWSWLIPPYRWNFMARALEDSVVLEFDGAAILARCEQDPAFGYELFKRFTELMSTRLNAARQTMMDQWNPPGFA
jgi:CRP-like cAMP-binding protein